MSPTWHLIPNISLERPRTQGEGEKGERDVQGTSAWEEALRR